MPRIYIVNKGCHDYSSAEEYGTLVFLSRDMYSRFSTGKIFRVFREIMRDSDPEDFILISGLSVMSSIACAIFSAKHQRVNLLLYNSGPQMEDHYVKRTIVMEDL
jgi:hypothetical protein